MEIDILLNKQEICNDVAAELNLLGRTLDLSSGNDGKGGTNLRELANLIRTPDDNETKPIVARAMQEAWSSVKTICQRYNAFGRKADDNRLEAIIIKGKEDYVIPDSVFPSNEFSALEFNLGVAITFLPLTTYNIELDMPGLTNSPGAFTLKVGSHIIGDINLAQGMEKVSLSYNHGDTIEDGAFFTLVKNDLTSPDPIMDGIHQNKLSYSYNHYDTYNLQLVMPNNFNVSVTSSITAHAHRHIVDTVIAAVLKNQQQDGYVKYLASAEKAGQELLRILQARNSFGRVQHDWM